MEHPRVPEALKERMEETKFPSQYLGLYKYPIIISQIIILIESPEDDKVYAHIRPYLGVLSFLSTGIL
jgi:hypothetical protein